MLDFLVTLGFYMLILYLFYDRIERYLAALAPADAGYFSTLVPEEESDDESIADVIAEVIEEELRVDAELEREHQLNTIRKRLTAPDVPS